MNRVQIVVVIVGVVLIALIYSLPKVIVNNKNKNLEASSGEQGQDHVDDDMHAAPDQAFLNQVADLKAKFENSNDQDSKLKLADSLISMYSSGGRFDSAAIYAGIIANLEPLEKNTIRAGDLYYEAFSFAIDMNRADLFAQKAEFLYTLALDKNNNLTDVKSKMAMLYVSGKNPMQAINLLKEVLAQDPEHELAIFNLGILSMQSKQYDKAIERFEKLTKLYPDNIKAQFYLALSYKESGNKEKAREHFEIAQKMDKDPEIQAAIAGYLQDIK